MELFWEENEGRKFGEDKAWSLNGCAAAQRSPHCWFRKILEATIGHGVQALETAHGIANMAFRHRKTSFSASPTISIRRNFPISTLLGHSIAQGEKNMDVKRINVATYLTRE